MCCVCVCACVTEWGGETEGEGERGKRKRRETETDRNNEFCRVFSFLFSVSHSLNLPFSLSVLPHTFSLSS